MSNQPKYIFIGGSGRSGTTLVQKILLGHPKIGGGPELYFTKPIFELLDKMLKAHQGNCFHSSISKQELEKMVKQLYDGLLLAHDSGDLQYISEKTPTNIHVAETLLRTYPSSRFINVYRDGRAVLNSHFNVKKRAKKKDKNLTEISLRKTSIQWNKCIEDGINAKHNFPNRVINISYEKLIASPDKLLTAVFNRLNLLTYSEMLKPESIELKEGEGKPHINNIWYTEEMYGKGFDTSKLTEWKKEMSSFQQFWASSIMYFNLKALGYNVKPSHRLGNRLFFFFYNIKDFVKANSIFYPFLYIKRKLF